MEERQFKTALWGFSWEEVLEHSEQCEQGAVRFDGRGITLEIPFGQLFSDETSQVIGRRGLPYEKEYVYGFTQDGLRLVLVDARSAGTSESYPGGVNQKVHATEILESKNEFDPQLKITEASAKITGLREWYGRAPLKAAHCKDKGVDQYEVDWREALEQSVVLCTCNECTIRLFHEIRASSLEVSGFNVSHECGVRMTFASPVERREALTLMVRFSDFISVCMGFDAVIESIGVQMEGEEDVVKCHKPFVVGSPPSSHQLVSFPIGWKTLGDEAQSIVAKWMFASSDLAEAESLLCSLLFNDWRLPIELKFIGAAQLLELLSKYNIDNNGLPVDVHEEYLRLVKGSLRGVGDSSMYKWVTNRLGGNDKGQGRLLRELLERHGEVSDLLLPSRKSYVGKHIAARNHYMHRGGQKAALGHEELFWHTEGTLLLCYGILLELVGASPDFAVNSIRRWGTKAWVVSKLRELYSE